MTDLIKVAVDEEIVAGVEPQLGLRVVVGRVEDWVVAVPGDEHLERRPTAGDDGRRAAAASQTAAGTRRQLTQLVHLASQLLVTCYLDVILALQLRQFHLLTTSFSTLRLVS